MTREQTKGLGTQRSFFAKEVRVCGMEGVATAKYLKECGGGKISTDRNRHKGI